LTILHTNTITMLDRMGNVKLSAFPKDFVLQVKLPCDSTSLTTQR